MARGFLTGLIWGSVLSVGGAAVVSLNAGLPQPPQVSTTAPVTPEPAAQMAATAPTPPAAQAPAQTSKPETAPAQPVAPAVPDTQELATLDTQDPETTQAPAIGSAQPLPDTAAGTAAAPQIATVEDNTVRTPEPAALGDTQATDAPRISTAPATPAPQPEPETTAPDTAEAEAETPTQDADASDTLQNDPDAQSGVASAAAPLDPVDTDPLTDTGVAEATIIPDPDPEPAPSQPAAPAQSTEVAPAPRVAALPRVETETRVETAPETSETTQVALAPSIGQRVVPLPDRSNGGSSLPSVTVQPAPQPQTDTATAAPAATNLPPVDRFATPFDNTEGKPLMGIVLIDDAGSFGAEALASFPYPLSFAIDPLDPQAADKMQRYRAAGFEVLALIDMPENGTAQDAETILEVGLSKLSESVGVLEGTQTGFQGNRALSDQVTAVLRDQGYGLITQNSGLNTVQKLAAREGVPSAFVFRDIDGAGQTPTVMRRFLDQAAFRAGQDGAVIMLARVRPDTISALLLWGLQDRASRVALAPVSAVLRAQTPPTQ